jgi:hypothetical protein
MLFNTKGDLFKVMQATTKEPHKDEVQVCMPRTGVQPNNKKKPTTGATVTLLHARPASCTTSSYACKQMLGQQLAVVQLRQHGVNPYSALVPAV